MKTTDRAGTLASVNAASVGAGPVPARWPGRASVPSADGQCRLYRCLSMPPHWRTAIASTHNTGGLSSRRTRFSHFLRLNRLERQEKALLTYVSRFADLRQQICRPSSADLPTFVSRFADLRQQQLESLFGTIELGLRFIKNWGWLQRPMVTLIIQ